MLTFKKNIIPIKALPLSPCYKTKLKMSIFQIRKTCFTNVSDMFEMSIIKTA